MNEIREALQHQRFPVHILENKTPSRSSGQASNRVVVNFIPTTHMGYFAGAAATGDLTHSGIVDQLGLMFFRDGDQLFLSRTGAGQLFSNYDASDLAERLERVMVAMAADPAARLSSMDLLDESEHARLNKSGAHRH